MGFRPIELRSGSSPGARASRHPLGLDRLTESKSGDTARKEERYCRVHGKVGAGKSQFFQTTKLTE